MSKKGMYFISVSWNIQSSAATWQPSDPSRCVRASAELWLPVGRGGGVNKQDFHLLAWALMLGISDLRYPFCLAMRMIRVFTVHRGFLACDIVGLIGEEIGREGKRMERERRLKGGVFL
jgi:hypothetical protein